MKHYLITSQIKTDSVGGVNTAAKLFLALFPKYTPKELELYEAFFSIFTVRSYLIFGYADTAVYKVLILFLLRGREITYCPCFHPWWTMRRKYLAFFYERTIFLVLLRSRNIICLSGFEEAYFKKLYKKANTIIINHPVKMTSKTVGSNRASIIFIGRDDENKQINEFIHLKNLINSWGEGYQFEIVSDTERVFDGDIIHHRYLNEIELASLYSRACAILITSKWESLSLVGVEAVIAGAKAVCRETVMLGEHSKYFPTLILNSYQDTNNLRAFLKAPIDKAEHECFVESFSLENMKHTLSGVL